MALDAVVLGAAGIDTCVFVQGGDVDLETDGSFSENLDYVGQAGGFCSRAFARLGYKTGFIGYVGDDYHGDFLTRELARDGIELTVFRDPRGTRRSVNLMLPDGRRHYFFDGKGSMDVQPDTSACRAMLARSRLAHFSIENWCRYLLEPAGELGVTVSCDLQDLPALGDPYRRDFIEAADILFFSAARLDDPVPTVRECLRARPDQVVVVGRGPEGCAVGAAGDVQLFPPVDLPLPLLDTNGAGDALAVGFLASYVLDGLELTESVRRGQAAARYACTQKASTSSLVSRSQLDFLAPQLRST
jgi:sugar/nucleoside kinase (ribokinase family)